MIDKTFKCCRIVYNKGIEMRDEAHINGLKIGYQQTSKMLTEIKK